MKNRILYQHHVSMDEGEFKREIRVSEKLLESGYWKIIFRFLLIGEKGAAQFMFHMLTKHPEEAQDFLQGKWEGFRMMFGDVVTPSGGQIIPTDLGFHSREPKESLDPIECDVLGGKCWYEGTTFYAVETMEKVMEQRSFQVVWDELMDFYQSETTPTT